VIRKTIAAAVAALAAVLTVGAAAASANPGPGNSFACAPGQQGNPAPGFKPAACDHR
jgi:hypothetical protein